MLLRKTIFFLILIFSFSSAIAAEVYEGTEATIENFPWIVAIYPSGLSPLEGVSCGGTIIAKYWILTAAHCVYNKYTRQKFGANELSIGMGSASLGSLNRVRIENIFLFDDKFDPNNKFVNDLALIESRTELRADPVKLGNIEDYSKNGLVLAIVGWGATKRATFSRDLMTDEIDYATNESCLKIPEYTDKLNSNVFCAGQFYKDTCEGDSGGPILTVADKGRGTQLGITTGGTNCGENAGVYTKITPEYKSWIETRIKSTRDILR